MGSAAVFSASAAIVALNYVTLWILKEHELGHLESAVSVVSAEFLKIPIAYTLFLVFEKRKKIGLNKVYAVPALLLNLHMFLLLFTYRKMHSLTFQLCCQSKVLFTFLLSFIFLRRRFSHVQYIAQLILFAGLLMMVFSAENTLQKINDPPHIVALVVLAALFNASSAVYFEGVVRGSGRGVWENAFLVGSFSLGVSSIYLFYNLCYNSLSISLLSPWFVSYVLCQTAYGLLMSYLVMKCSAVAKTLVSVGSTSVTTVAFIYQFDESVNLLKLLSAFLVFSAIFLFNCQRIRRIKKSVI